MQGESARAMQTFLPILIFHSLDDLGSVISFPPPAFRSNMAKLHDSGYRTLSLLDAAERLRLGELFPSRSFVLTFDDGYASVYHQAFPVLEQYGMTATVFVTTGRSRPSRLSERLPSYEGRTMLSWNQISELQRWGIDIGAHTCSHPDLVTLPTCEIQDEVSASKAVIEDTLGAKVYSFAYPYGRFDRRSRDIAAQHFGCACSDVLALVTPRSDRYALERVDAYYLRPEKLFDLMLTAAFPWYLRARRFARGIKRALVPRPT
jgi:peptidoglycan/xylan/chitin deacetylase (PgdA/CDA1 family)